MPHIEIKCYTGKTEEQKKACAEKVTAAIMETLGCTEAGVSIAIKDVDKENWKEEVWDKEIVADDEYLYKKPGYTCE